MGILYSAVLLIYIWHFAQWKCIVLHIIIIAIVIIKMCVWNLRPAHTHTHSYVHCTVDYNLFSYFIWPSEPNKKLSMEFVYLQIIASIPHQPHRSMYWFDAWWRYFLYGIIEDWRRCSTNYTMCNTYCALWCTCTEPRCLHIRLAKLKCTSKYMYRHSPFTLSINFPCTASTFSNRTECIPLRTRSTCATVSNVANGNGCK